MDNITLDFIVLFLALFLSAFFSGSETALFSLKQSDLHRYAVSSDNKEKLISRLMHYPEKILITILSGNLFVNIIISAITTSLLLYQFGEYGHFIAIAVVTPLLIIFCEISPKVIATNNSELFSKRIINVLEIFHKIFIPLRYLLLIVTNFIIKILSLSLDEKVITEEELDMAIKLGEAEGVINEGEKTFINNVLRFSKKEAANVMIPRNMAIFVPYNSDIKTVVDICIKEGIVRAPVYKINLDNVVGVIDSRELVPYVTGYKNAKKINTLIHDIDHYPASKELGELLTEFLEKKIQIAIVVDEYGGTAGVVTLKTILAELMGKEFIESDENRKEEIEIKEIDKRNFIISGDMQIVDFNFEFGEVIESNESESIGGYIIERLGYFPKRSEELVTDRTVLTVRHIKKNKIESIEIKLRENK